MSAYYRCVCLVFPLFLTDILNADTEQSSEDRYFYEDHARGWHWYEREAQADDLNSERDSTNPNVSQAQYPATEELKLYQARLEEAKAKAVMHPTAMNVAAYQRMQYEMIEKSGKFAEIWMRNVYRNPDIDYAQKSPTSQNAKHIYLAEQKKEAEEKIHKLSREYGLFFFFKNECPYCDAFASTVKGFSEKYGWDVLAISEFGEKHELFKRSVQDNGLAENWGVSVYPSLFAVNPKTGHVIHVAMGMISIQEMEERIIAIVNESENGGEDG